MKKAFTLLELVFVIAMLGVLASIAIPKFATNKNEVEIKKAKAQIAQIRAGITSYVNKQILAGESDIYPLYLESKDGKHPSSQYPQPGGVNKDELFNIILNDPIKSNFGTWRDAKSGLTGWSSKANYALRYMYFLGNGDVLLMDYCAPKNSPLEKTSECNNAPIGSFICSGNTAKVCESVGEASYAAK